MTEVVVLKPRRKNSPFRFNGTVYPQIVDDLGVVRIHVEDPVYLAFCAANPDTFEVPGDLTKEVTNVPVETSAASEDPAAGEPAADPAESSAAVKPVAVVSAGEEPAAPSELKPGKRKSRLNA